MGHMTVFLSPKIKPAGFLASVFGNFSAMASPVRQWIDMQISSSSPHSVVL